MRAAVAIELTLAGRAPKLWVAPGDEPIEYLRHDTSAENYLAAMGPLKQIAAREREPVDDWHELPFGAPWAAAPRAEALTGQFFFSSSDSTSG